MLLEAADFTRYRYILKRNRERLTKRSDAP